MRLRFWPIRASARIEMERSSRPPRPDEVPRNEWRTFACAKCEATVLQRAWIVWVWSPWEGWRHRIEWRPYQASATYNNGYICAKCVEQLVALTRE